MLMKQSAVDVSGLEYTWAITVADIDDFLFFSIPGLWISRKHALQQKMLAMHDTNQHGQLGSS